MINLGWGFGTGFTDYKKESVRENLTEGCITHSLVVSLIDDAYNRVE